METMLQYLESIWTLVAPAVLSGLKFDPVNCIVLLPDTSSCVVERVAMMGSLPAPTVMVAVELMLADDMASVSLVK